MSVNWHPTPQNPSTRVLLEHDGVLRRFLKFELNARGDGSLYISFPLSGTSPNDLTWSSAEPQLQTRDAVRSGIDLSYHTSGMVNPKNYGRGPIFCEPLYSITREQFLLTISIPSVDRLDIFAKAPGDAGRIVVPNDTRLTFAVVIAPADFTSWMAVPSMEVECGNLFRIGIIPQSDPTPPQGYDLAKHLIFLAPSEGPYGSIHVQPDEAFVRFHQHITGSQEVTIYGPNGKGEYLLVPAVPMRVPPKAKFEFSDNTHQAEIISATNHFVRYRITDANGQTVKQPLQVVSMTLDARM